MEKLSKGVVNTGASQTAEEATIEQRRLSSLFRISKKKSGPLKELLDFALDEAVALSDSKIGYLYFYAEDSQELTLHTWSKEVMRECAIDNPPTVYQLENTGLWGEAVRQRMPLIINDFAAPNPLKKGYPEGHAKLFRYMTLPVFSDGRIAAVVGVANKDSEYSALDAHHLELLMSSLWEIVGRRQTEEALKESESRYRRITETVTDYIYTVRVEEGKVVDTRHGPGCLVVTGYSEEELAADPYLWFRMVVEEDGPAVQEQARAVLSGEGAPAIEHRIIRKDGALRWVRNTPVPRYDTKGKLQVYDGLIQDITARKMAEIALRVSEHQFRQISREFHAVLDAIPDGISLISPELIVVWANQTAASRINSELADMVGQRCYKLWVQRTEPCESCPVLRCLKSGEPVISEVVSPAGRLIEVRVVPVKNADGKIVNFIRVGRDITEHRRLEEQFRQSQKMEAVGHLAGGIAHDFNNILTGIIGYATIVNGKVKEDGHIKPFLKQILDLADRAANLTHSLLAFSRKQVLDPKPLSIMDIVSGMQRILERIIGEDIRIRVLAGSEDLIVRADKSQVEQVLMNLATNARDAMPHGGQLTITIEEVDIDSRISQTHQYGEAGRYVVISFADTGVGMNKETKERMFEPFFTTKEVGKGTGLGLAMVYGTIKQHNGFIEVQSEPGEGTTFKMYLPSAGPASAQPAEKKKPAILSGTETVLLVEDDDAVRKVSRAMLEDLGYRVIETADGDDAIRLFAEYRDAVDLVLSDIIMPKRTGIDVQNELKKIKPDIKVLFVSGYTADMLTQKGSIETGISFIPKPLRLDSLSKKIREILDG